MPAVMDAVGAVRAGAVGAVARRPRPRGALMAAATELHKLLSCGHPRLGFNIQGAPSITEVADDGARLAPKDVRESESEDDYDRKAPQWRPSRTLKGGLLTPRRCNPHVLAQHLNGAYSVAPEAPSWVWWVCLDLDAHPDWRRDGAQARARARERCERMLATVWRALRCSSKRQPVVFQSPGGGFHVWFALSRGAGGNGEMTWPAWAVRAWFTLVLRERGVDVSAGRCEVYPSGRRLRAPCGPGMWLLQPQRPDDPDNLDLIRWPGTYSLRTEPGNQPQRDIVHVRRVVTMARTFLAAFEASRRPLAEWIDRPEASWDRTWAFFVWRPEGGSQKPVATVEGEEQSQQRDDKPPRALPGAIWPGSGGGGEPLVLGDGGTDPDPDHVSNPPPGPDPDMPPVPAGERVKGRAWRQKVNHLVTRGLTSPGGRHDAVLTLTFYFGAECGLGREATLQRIEEWSSRLPHAGSATLATKGRSAFVKVCRAEAANYFDGYAHRWPRRGHSVPCAPLSAGDWDVVNRALPGVRDEVAVLLSWLGGNADAAGLVADPVELAGGLVKALCPERRVAADGAKRGRRAAVVAVEELLRLGVITLHRKHWAGCHGRIYKVWHRFGASAAPAAHQTPQDARSAPNGAPLVAALVLAERQVPEGTLRILGDGTSAPPWCSLVPGPGVEAPAAPVDGRPPWWVRLYVDREYTVAEFWYGNAEVIPLPRRERVRYPWMRPRPARPDTAPGGTPLALVPVELALAVPVELVPLLPAGIADSIDGAWRTWGRRGAG